MDFDSAVRGLTRIAPSDSVVAGNAAVLVPKGTDNRQFGWDGAVEGDEAQDLVGVDQPRAYPVVTVDLSTPALCTRVRRTVGQRQVAPAREHDVVVELLAQRTEKADRLLVEGDAFRRGVV